MDFHLTTESAPGPAVSEFDFKLEYAQSAQAWSTYSEILDAHDNLPAINAILKQNYGVYEEAFGAARAGLEGIKTRLAPSPLAHAYLSVEAKASPWPSPKTR